MFEDGDIIKLLNSTARLFDPCPTAKFLPNLSTAHLSREEDQNLVVEL